MSNPSTPLHPFFEHPVHQRQTHQLRTRAPDEAQLGRTLVKPLAMVHRVSDPPLVPLQRHPMMPASRAGSRVRDPCFHYARLASFHASALSALIESPPLVRSRAARSFSGATRPAHRLFARQATAPATMAYTTGSACVERPPETVFITQTAPPAFGESESTTNASGAAAVS